MSSKRLLSLGEAAERVGTTPDNLRGAIHRGSLAATKMGRDWFVAEAEVDRYIAENRRGARLDDAAASA